MKKLLSIAVLVLIIVGFWFIFYSNDKESGNIMSNTPDEIEFKTYKNDTYGFEFAYPSDYYLEERKEEEQGRTHLSIVLYEDTEENKSVREGKSPGREGPVTVSVDIYRDTLDSPTLIEWLKDTPASNFNLSDGTFKNVTVAKKSAVTYRFDGLYQAEAVALSNKDYILAITVTFIQPDDSIREVFDSVVSSLKLNQL